MSGNKISYHLESQPSALTPLSTSEGHRPPASAADGVLTHEIANTSSSLPGKFGNSHKVSEMLIPKVYTHLPLRLPSHLPVHCTEKKKIMLLQLLSKSPLCPNAKPMCKLP